MQYFVKRGDKVHGPFSKSQLESGLKSKKLSKTDLISEDRSGPWKSINPSKVIKPELAQKLLEDGVIAGWLHDEDGQPKPPPIAAKPVAVASQTGVPLAKPLPPEPVEPEDGKIQEAMPIIDVDHTSQGLPSAPASTEYKAANIPWYILLIGSLAAFFFLILIAGFFSNPQAEEWAEFERLHWGLRSAEPGFDTWMASGSIVKILKKIQKENPDAYYETQSVGEMIKSYEDLREASHYLWKLGG
ncbi:DUF5305 domain-containing protein [bacterium]|nr:DUF5305 domain-containing protein [bacterium]